MIYIQWKITIRIRIIGMILVSASAYVHIIVIQRRLSCLTIVRLTTHTKRTHLMVVSSIWRSFLFLILHWQAQCRTVSSPAAFLFTSVNHSHASRVTKMTQWSIPSKQLSKFPFLTMLHIQSIYYIKWTNLMLNLANEILFPFLPIPGSSKFLFCVQTVLNAHGSLDYKCSHKPVVIYLLRFEGVAVLFPGAHRKLPSVKQFHQQQQRVDVRHFHLCNNSLLCLHFATIALLYIDPLFQWPYVWEQLTQNWFIMK